MWGVVGRHQGRPTPPALSRKQVPKMLRHMLLGTALSVSLLLWTACEGTKSEAPYTPESILVEDISDYLQTFLYPDLRILYGLLISSTPKDWSEWADEIEESWKTMERLDEDIKRRLAEEMGIDEDQLQGGQGGVYIRGAPITMPHPEARDHVYTLDEVCGVMLDAGYGLRGEDGELICEP